MRNLLVFVLMLTTTFTIAQKNVSWVGGTPGRVDNWEEPRNWSNQQVPDDFSNVFIPDVSTTTFAAPVIRNSKVVLNALRLGSNATLTVTEAGELVINGTVDIGRKDQLVVLGSFTTSTGKEISFFLPSKGLVAQSYTGW